MAHNQCSDRSVKMNDSIYCTFISSDTLFHHVDVVIRKRENHFRALFYQNNI